MGSREIRRIALDRISRLMEFAERHASKRPELARNAVLQAMRISQKARVRIPAPYRRMFCRKCGTFFRAPGSFTVRVRDRRSTHVVIKCRVCGHVKRFPAVKEKKGEKS